ncbi:MAG TPA: triose-phosphate isomerase [Pyrodictium delaneyi]|uniref:Triosephosphate isomerase n=1 Tax=Pyrodictium delaneyi TaxID=1273541 RepID=A0A832ZT29_9CREN|nr:triose-phosphate isomerase [Pyrodictium delaneyi]
MGTVLLSSLHAYYTSRREATRDHKSVPVLAVNYKAYPTAFGETGLAVALTAEKLAEEYDGIIRFILAVPATEIVRISESTDKAVVYAQHADPVEPGAHTGYLPLEALKEAGAKGTLLNHSEHRIRLSDIDTIVRRATQLGLETLVCADTPTAAAAAAILSPTMIAIEPPELIGTGVPVSKAKPEIITSTIQLVRMVNPDIPILAGAGITTGEDAATAIKLGANGVLVASAIMKAKDPEAKLLELAEALAKAAEKKSQQ